jgi:hypothetical protein
MLPWIQSLIMGFWRHLKRWVIWVRRSVALFVTLMSEELYSLHRLVIFPLEVSYGQSMELVWHDV